MPTTLLPQHVRPLFPYPRLNAMQSQCYETAFRSDLSLVVAAPTGRRRCSSNSRLRQRTVALSAASDHCLLILGLTPTVAVARPRS